MPLSGSQHKESSARISPFTALMLSAFGATVLSLTVFGLIASGKFSARLSAHEKLPTHPNSVTQREFDQRMRSLEDNLNRRLDSLERTINELLTDLRNR